MSKTPDATNPLTIIEEAPVEKQSFVKKMNPLPHIKKHPKIATAIGLGAVLVIGASVLGNDTDSDSTEPSEESMDEGRVALEEMGVPVTDEN